MTLTQYHKDVVPCATIFYYALAIARYASYPTKKYVKSVRYLFKTEK